MDSQDPASSTPTPAWALRAAVALAFAPVALDLARHWAAEPWARYSALFPLLFLLCARHEARRSPDPRGTLWILAGLGLEVACAFLGAIRWARIGMALGAVGLCQKEGWGTWRSRALLLLVVPMPWFLVKLGGGEAARGLGDLAVGVWRAAGADVLRSGLDIVAGSELLVHLSRSWLTLGVLLGGLVWYDRARRGGSWPAAVALGLGAAILAWPLHATLLILAVGIGIASGGTAPSLLDHAWIAVAGAGILFTELRARRAAGVSR